MLVGSPSCSSPDTVVAITDDGVHPPAGFNDGPLLGLTLIRYPGERLTAIAERMRRLYDINADGCMPWRGACNSQGTPNVRLDFWTQMPAARLARLLVGLPVPVAGLVTQTCGTPKCINPQHTTIVMPRRGKPRPTVRRALTREAVARIRHEYALGVSRRTLAMRYRRCVARIHDLTRDITPPKKGKLP